MSDDKDPNAKFCILSLDKEKYQQRVYLLNPGDYFEGFGGSRHALRVNKTASLIVRTNGYMGLQDTEYDITRMDVWDSIFNAVRNTQQPTK